MNKVIAFVLLFLSASLVAQVGQDPSNNSSQKEKGRITVQGCVGRSSGDFVLIQTDPGNSYVLRPNGKIKLEHYLGHQVQVTGAESSTMRISSNGGKGSSISITVDSINTISKRCTS